jgi:hypothetical protein
MMMKKICSLLVTLTLASVAGCGSSDNNCDEAGCLDVSVTSYDAGGPDGAMQWGLSRGTNPFKITAVKDVTSDTCMTKPGEVIGNDIAVTYDENTMFVSVGKQVGSPTMAFFGSGKVAGNKATLTRENKSGDVAPCTWDEKDVSQFELYDHDKFTLKITQNQSGFMMCGTTAPAGGTCTSSWTWSIEKK